MNTQSPLPVLSKKIILGSKSPRRSQLLREAGFTFDVRTAETDESFDPSMNVYHVAAYLAEKKAEDLIYSLQQDEILITADSVVIIDDTILGKPVDEAEAFEFISTLAGRIHKVITGVCICTQTRRIVFDDMTEVTFLEMNTDEIWHYIRNYPPMDKAGAYGIQDWIGLCKVQSINGSYANVMGLPVHRLYLELSKIFK